MEREVKWLKELLCRKTVSSWKEARWVMSEERATRTSEGRSRIEVDDVLGAV